MHILLTIAVAALLAPACNASPEGKKAPESYSTERSQSVAGKTSPKDPNAIAELAKDVAAESGPAKAPDPLCDVVYEAATAKPLTLPATETLRQGAEVAPRSWRWLNLWASWCAPCVAEMPQLADWAKRRRDEGTAIEMVFLSLDDDKRQLDAYMKSSGNALAATFLWAKDESLRAPLLLQLGVADPPTLPVHALIDPDGKLRCVRTGEIEAPNLDEAARFLR